jgi:hypothetical protein
LLRAALADRNASASAAALIGSLISYNYHPPIRRFNGFALMRRIVAARSGAPAIF